MLAYELTKRGLAVRREVPVPVRYGELEFEVGFRADLVVEGLVIVEVKSVQEAHPVHKKQLLTYLRMSGLRLGLLLNFGQPMMRDGISRVVNRLPDAVTR